MTVRDEKPSTPEPHSDRVRLRRARLRGDYDPVAIRRILDAGVVVHVGVMTDGGPMVVPMAYGRDDQALYLHGSVANASLRAAVDRDVCATVTILDGLVVARSPFHNSANYRSAVVRGVARQVTDPHEKLRALKLISDHVVPTWDGGRPPTDAEIARTLVVALSLVEASAKIRTGDPVDEPEDLAGPHWAGELPVHTTFGRPVPARDLASGIEVPPAVGTLSGGSVYVEDRSTSPPT